MRLKASLMRLAVVFPPHSSPGLESSMAGDEEGQLSYALVLLSLWLFEIHQNPFEKR